MKIESHQEWLDRAETLKSYRAASGLTVKDLSKITGVSEPTLYKLEKGQRVRRHILIKLAPLVKAWLINKWV